MSAETFATLRNGESLPLSRVPRLPFERFREDVISEVAGGRRLACLCADHDLNGYAVLADAEAPLLHVTRTHFPERYPSFTPHCPQAHLFEREMAEQWGLVPEGHPWFKPVRFHHPWKDVPDAWGRDPDGDLPPGQADFYRVEGDQVHEVAVGPVHAGVIEPGHFRFQCHGEEVFHLEIALGYQHRGLERALWGGPHPLSLKQMEAAAGDTSIGHAWAYCQLLEGLAGAQMPPRVQTIRAISLELERLANHTGDLGALANDVGFLPTASFCGRLRGDWLNQSALLCGSRLGRDLLRPGGVGFDLEPTRLIELREQVEAIAKGTRDAVDLLWKTGSVIQRFEATGRVLPSHAADAGLVGPAARACGLGRDVRTEFPFGPYAERPVGPCVEETGDVMARARVRAREIEASVDFIQGAIEDLLRHPAGPLRVEMGHLPHFHLGLSLIEGWRGEILHLAVTDAAGRFRLYKLVDPSFHNWFGLALALRGEQISDFPLCNKSFNLSYCGFDL